jgi:ERI1 exoribonuclease 3
MHPKPAVQKQLEYFLILDFEATCGDSVQHGQREIIEFPTLLYDLKKKEVLAQFHEYVKPVRHPALTDFCTELTGIKQVCYIYFRH